MKNISDKICRENQNTHFVFKNFFYIKLCPLWDVRKYVRAGQATDDNMEQAHCMLHTWRYIQTLRICYPYCSVTTTLFARTRLRVALYVHCPSCYNCDGFYCALRAEYSNKIQVRLTLLLKPGNRLRRTRCLQICTADKDTDMTEVPTSLSSHRRSQCDLEFYCLRIVCLESKQVGQSTP